MDEQYKDRSINYRLLCECEWCGTKFTQVKSQRTLDYNETVKSGLNPPSDSLWAIVLGWCPKCNGWLWSKPAEWEAIDG